MVFFLPVLPYALDALDPALSAVTLWFHHGKHHRAYVNKLNQLVRGTRFESATLEEIVREAKDETFNNAAQHYNHSFYWQCMTPGGQKLSDAAFATTLEKQFGSLDAFHELFAKKAESLFGTGWCWLVKDKNGNLLIEQAPDAGCPIAQGHVPLLTCDVWEHAYYIDYHNERARYIRAFLEIVDWRFVAERFQSDEAWSVA